MIRVFKSCVKPYLQRAYRHGDGTAVDVLAERAGMSERTMWRYLTYDRKREEAKALEAGEPKPDPTMDMDTADRLMLAADQQFWQLDDEAGCVKSVT